MSVSSIFSNSNSSYDLSHLNVASTDSASATSSDLASVLSGTDSTSTASGSTSTSVSNKAKLQQQLQQLQQTDPAKFKQVTADIASKLQEEAKQVGGSQGQALSKVADTFQQASQTGSLPDLKSGGHHHHHGGGGGGGAATPTSTVSSPASAAATAYQQSGGSSIKTDVDSIISQVLSSDSASTVGASS